MAIQPITRQALFKKMANVVNKLPNEQLQQLWTQLDSWESMLAHAGHDNQSTPSSADLPAVVEVTVPPQFGRQKPLIRLPLRSTGPIPPVIMEEIMEVGEAPDDTDPFMQQLRDNIAWWNQNYAKILNDATFVGRYIAIAAGEVFAGDSYLEAYEKVHQVYPDGAPYIFLLLSPQEVTHHAN